MTEEEFLKEAFMEACRQELEELDEQIEDIDMERDDKFKRKMNRLFREELGSKNIPHPEADNVCERVRSGIICFFKRIKPQ